MRFAKRHPELQFVYKYCHNQLNNVLCTRKYGDVYMKKNTLALSVLVALCTFPSMANDKQIWLGGFAEYYYADKDKFQTLPKDRIDWGWGLELGERFNSSWGGRFEYAHINLEAYPGQTAIDGYRLGFDAMYFPFENDTYVFAGLKHESLDQGYNLGNLGLGKHWALTEKWKVITEVAAYHEFGESHKDFSGKLGLLYQFGTHTSPAKPAPAPVLDSDNDGVIDEKDRCPNTATGMAVDTNGCALPLDSDKDGVIDSQDKCPDTPQTDKTDADGCTLFNETQESITLAVHFENNSSKIRDSEIDDLRRFAEFMKKYPDVSAQIEGHSSAPGNADYNLSLSEARAKATKQMLIDKYGVDASRLTAVGYGETRLLNTANTQEAHQQNRRIEAKMMVTKRKKVTK